MKKLKRIICIVLVLICLCMQGCSWEEMAERAKERRISTAKKYMQEHKQIVDSFDPNAFISVNESKNVFRGYNVNRK